MDDDADVRTATLALIDRLTAMTRSGKVVWEFAPSARARLLYGKMEYLLTSPSGELLMLVNGVLLWKGYGLGRLCDAVQGQLPGLCFDHRTSAPMDYRVPDVLTKALKTLKD